MEAIILAGGLGTRLRNYIGNVPKAMAPIAGRPFLAWLLEHLQDNGFGHVILSIGYLADIIRQQFGEQFEDLKISYVVEEFPLGTGGAIRNALRGLNGDDQPIWILNGDTFVELSFENMWRQHVAKIDPGPLITVALSAVDNSLRYGSVKIRKNRIVEF